MTNSEIDRLGDRLKHGNPTDNDLTLLDAYRASFGQAYKEVIGALRGQLALNPSGREAKTTASIIAKLQRERTRLSRMQDIAGSRVVVTDLVAQNRVTEAVKRAFVHTKIVDRRERPSHGYRAVHAIVEVSGRQIEIQIRTHLQHWWAELSEKASDRFGNAVKYGEGPGEVLERLLGWSDVIATIETLELDLTELESKRSQGQNRFLSDHADEIASVQRQINEIRKNAIKGIKDFLTELATLRQ